MSGHPHPRFRRFAGSLSAPSPAVASAHRAQTQTRRASSAGTRASVSRVIVTAAHQHPARPATAPQSFSAPQIAHREGSSTSGMAIPQRYMMGCAPAPIEALHLGGVQALASTTGTPGIQARGHATLATACMPNGVSLADGRDGRRRMALPRRHAPGVRARERRGGLQRDRASRNAPNPERRDTERTQRNRQPSGYTVLGSPHMPSRILMSTISPRGGCETNTTRSGSGRITIFSIGPLPLPRPMLPRR
jgi:hypothetical protein